MPKNEEEIEKLLADDSFVAWIEGSATKKEAVKWNEWLKNDPARKQLVEEARSFHQNIDFKATQRPEVEEELSRLNDAVDRYEESREEIKEPRVFQIGQKTMYSNVAAVVFLLIAVMGVVTFLYWDFDETVPTENDTTEFITTSTQNGQQKVLTLSDGSTIKLNANSSLRYPSQYSGGDLEVWLEGEAYFDITRETGADERSFSVIVPDGAINVLGTQFNVNTYEVATEVVLVDGRVNIEMRDSLNQVQDSYVMQPGEISRLSVDNRIKTRKVEPDVYTAWTQDKLIFERTPLAEVAKRVEQIYDVRFQLDDHELQEILISGSLPNNELDVFLNTLENMLNRPVTNNDGLITLGELKQDSQ